MRMRNSLNTVMGIWCFRWLGPKFEISWVKIVVFCVIGLRGKEVRSSFCSSDFEVICLFIFLTNCDLGYSLLQKK